MIQNLKILIYFYFSPFSNDWSPGGHSIVKNTWAWAGSIVWGLGFWLGKDILGFWKNIDLGGG